MKKINLYEYLMSEKSSGKKAVNETFSEFKRANTPRFDIDGYKNKLERFIRTLMLTVNSGEIETVYFMYPYFALSNNGESENKVVAQWDANTNATADNAPVMCEKLIAAYTNIYKDKLATFMPATSIRMSIPEMSGGTSNMAYKYIDSLLDKPNAKHIREMDYINVVNRLNNAETSGYDVIINTQDFMEHFNEINEFFS